MKISKTNIIYGLIVSYFLLGFITFFLDKYLNLGFSFLDTIFSVALTIMSLLSIFLVYLFPPLLQGSELTLYSLNVYGDIILFSLTLFLIFTGLFILKKK